MWFGSNWKAIILSILLAGLSGSLVQCSSADEDLSAGEDRVTFTNGGTGENGILVGGMKNGSPLYDERFTGPAGSDIPVGNFTAPPVPRGAVIAFTGGRAPTLKTVEWTKDSETVTLDFEKEYDIPVTVWIVSGDFNKQRELAIRAAEKTSQIWSDERQGIRFSVFDDIKDATGKADGRYSKNPFNCNNMGDAIQRDIGATPGMINVYYVDMVETTRGVLSTSGVLCAANNLIALGQNTSDHLLAHELGHIFTLEHIDHLSTDSPTASGPVNFDRTNVMHPASNERNYLTEGQTYRAVNNKDSAINLDTLYNARPGMPTASNYCGTASDARDPTCPPVQKRIWKDGGENNTTWDPN